MSKRKAILIECSNTPKQDDLPGCKNDVSNWRKFLTSSLGGSWDSSEIPELSSTPTKTEVFDEINKENVDYLFLAFSGHGCNCDDEDYIHLKDCIIKVSEIEEHVRKKAKKACFVIDACRSNIEQSDLQIIQQRLDESAEGKLTNIQWWDYLNKQKEGIVKIFACEKTQTTHNLPLVKYPSCGGVFTTSLIKAASTWAEKEVFSGEIFDTKLAFLSACLCASIVFEEKVSNPVYMSNPQYLNYPFAVV